VQTLNFIFNIYLPVVVFDICCLKIICAPTRLPQMKPSIKFEVFSSSCFEGVFDRMPKICGVT